VSIICARFAAGRERGALVLGGASDECYLGLGWDAEPVSVWHRRCATEDHTGLLAVHSRPRAPRLAGLQGGLRRRGDASWFGRPLLGGAPKNAGMMVPRPVRAVAMGRRLGRDPTSNEQRDRYRRRRDALLPASVRPLSSPSTIHAGLYIWVTRGEACRDTVAWLAQRASWRRRRVLTVRGVPGMSGWRDHPR